ncbi:MAG: GNAT family N-acetyltransferase [Actinomycetota bacterium]|nr:GNAT family N-acetyltransferase [Actinomycetota bacterium]
MELIRPSEVYLDSYVRALRRGWSPDNTPPHVADEQLRQIEENPQAFFALMDDRDGAGPPITLPDGSTASRLPGFRLWMWDGEVSGSIGLRWQPGSPGLPPHCLGHAGYSVVEWKRNRGYATRALAQLCPLAREVGLPWFELTTDLGNVASQKVILANGGELIEEFAKPAVYGGGSALRFRIYLNR